MDQQPVTPPLLSRRHSPAHAIQELEQAINESSDSLASANTTLTLFPDTIALDRNILTFTKREFFSTAQVISIRIEDISSVTATVGPLFGSVSVMTLVPSSKPYKLGRFWREDALRFKRIAQGYVVAIQRKIDCSALSTDALRTLLNELGSDEHN